MPESAFPIRMPPAVEAAYRILGERGPLSAVDLRDVLRSQGFSQPIDRLAHYPDRFPKSFQLTDAGLLSVASSAPTAAAAESEDVSEDSEWYRPTDRSRVPVDRVAVLDIETTGLDPERDFVSELALVRLDGTPLTHVAVELPEGVTRPHNCLGPEMTLSQALRSLETHTRQVDLLIGHNVLAFDMPFLAMAAKRAGINPPQLYNRRNHC
ncbi:hypothetical protein [uncultured Mycobacterium sp.]|uniref:3'-5' exonuclease n=1 Tax=uncultured Mycobacterium sp. TaxID=171292 RepID=UPI0035CA082F